VHAGYRPDIDGLRAVAVLSVIIYHSFPTWAPGGFIGVDIFFVISGFLISTIILEALRQERFSYRDFYARRIRRIFPALLLVLTFCLVVGWFALYSLEYEPLGRYIAGAAAFVANILFWRDANYFEPDRDLKPLLHLWSLGVEEQFYIFWPPLLVLSWRIKRRVVPVIIVAFLLSFAVNIHLVGQHPAMAFFLPFCRGWELMVGAITAYAALNCSTVMKDGSPLQKHVLECTAWIGLFGLAAALLLINEHMQFPGWWALLPTLATAFLISAGPFCLVNRRLLSNPALVFVGVISYPAYLWHWPLLSFNRIMRYGPLPAPTRLMLIAATFLLAWLTYRVIERPVRFNRSPFIVSTLCTIGIVVIALGLLIELRGGVWHRAINASRLPYLRLIVDSMALDHKLHASINREVADCKGLSIEASTKRYCSSYGAKTDAASTVVIWGDSHAEAWAPVFYQIADELHLRVIAFIHWGCPPLIGVRRSDPGSEVDDCASVDRTDQVAAAIRAIGPSHIFLIGRWSLYTRGWMFEGQLQPATHFITTDPRSPADEVSSESAIESQLLKTLEALPVGTPVTVFKTMPVLYTYVERGLLRRLPLEPTASDRARIESVSNHAIDVARSRLPNLTVFDPAAGTCQDTCRAVLNGIVLYTDDNHISAQGALTFKNSLQQDYFASSQRRMAAPILAGNQSD
jgi:peptidoglycan/LPS O-acetylase OafA/YrhL